MIAVGALIVFPVWFGVTLGLRTAVSGPPLG